MARPIPINLSGFPLAVVEVKLGEFRVVPRSELDPQIYADSRYLLVGTSREVPNVTDIQRNIDTLVADLMRKNPDTPVTLDVIKAELQRPLYNVVERKVDYVQ